MATCGVDGRAGTHMDVQPAAVKGNTLRSTGETKRARERQRRDVQTDAHGTTRYEPAAKMQTRTAACEDVFCC